MGESRPANTVAPGSYVVLRGETKQLLVEVLPSPSKRRMCKTQVDVGTLVGLPLGCWVEIADGAFRRCRAPDALVSELCSGLTATADAQRAWTGRTTATSSRSRRTST